MNVLSIQSQVVYGHVGNSAAAFVLQRQGHAVWQVPTVLFSNHLGKPTFRGRAVPAEQARDLIQGLKELGYLDDVDMLLTGYLGTPDTARLAAELAGIIRAQKPHAIFACDPVMGDDDALYVKPDLAEAITSDLVPIADVLLPNIFELARLTGRTVKDGAAALEAAQALQRSSGREGAGGDRHSRRPPGSHRRAGAGRRQGASRRSAAPQAAGVRHRRHLQRLFTGHYVRDRDAGGALDFAMHAMDVICTATEKADADELLIVQTQNDWAKLKRPTRRRLQLPHPALPRIGGGGVLPPPVRGRVREGEASDASLDATPLPCRSGSRSPASRRSAPR